MQRLFRRKGKDDESTKGSKKGLSRWKTAPDLWGDAKYLSPTDVDMQQKPHLDYSRPRSGVFGIRLSTAPKSKEKPNIPEVVDRLVGALSNRTALSSPGIFQLPGDPLAVARIREQLNRNMNVELDSEEPYALATLLLNYFKEVPSPIVPAELAENFLSAVREYANKDMDASSLHTSTSEGTEKELVDILNGISECLDLMVLLNDENHALLKYLVKFLYRATLYSSVSKMDAKRMGETWGSIVIRTEGDKKDKDHGSPAVLMRLLIEHFARLFPADLSQSHLYEDEDDDGKRKRAATIDSPGKPEALTNPDASIIDFREKRTVDFVTDLDEYSMNVPDSASVLSPSNMSEPGVVRSRNRSEHLVSSSSHGSESKESKKKSIVPLASRGPTTFNASISSDGEPMESVTTPFLNVTGEPKKLPKSPRTRNKSLKEEESAELKKKRYRMSMPSKELSELVHSQAHQQRRKYDFTKKQKAPAIVPELEPWPTRKKSPPPVEKTVDPEIKTTDEIEFPKEQQPDVKIEVETAEECKNTTSSDVKKQRRKREDLSLLLQQQQQALEEAHINTEQVVQPPSLMPANKTPPEELKLTPNPAEDAPNIENSGELLKFVSFLNHRCEAVSREASYLADTCGKIASYLRDGNPSLQTGDANLQVPSGQIPGGYPQPYSQQAPYSAPYFTPPYGNYFAMPHTGMYSQAPPPYMPQFGSPFMNQSPWVPQMRPQYEGSQTESPMQKK